jgi:acetolactate synthase-1/2/3 large subunit
VPSQLVPDERALVLSDESQDGGRALAALADALGAAPTVAATGATDTVATTAAPSGSEPLDPAITGAILAANLPEGAIVVDEAATSGLPFYAASAVGPRHTLMSLTGGAIGQGLPCATGAAIACPDRPVIAFQADGSALYTSQALWTQAREGLHVITLLCSNRAYRILQVELARSGVAEAGPKARALTNLSDPPIDWVSLATGYGVPASRASDAAELVAALRRALAEAGPSLIELTLG